MIQSNCNEMYIFLAAACQLALVRPQIMKYRTLYVGMSDMLMQGYNGWSRLKLAPKKQSDLRGAGKWRCTSPLPADNCQTPLSNCTQ